jgi:hypothetical protein
MKCDWPPIRSERPWALRKCPSNSWIPAPSRRSAERSSPPGSPSRLRLRSDPPLAPGCDMRHRELLARPFGPAIFETVRGIKNRANASRGSPWLQCIQMRDQTRGRWKDRFSETPRIRCTADAAPRIFRGWNSMGISAPDRSNRGPACRQSERTDCSTCELTYSIVHKVATYSPIT